MISSSEPDSRQSRITEMSPGSKETVGNLSTDQTPSLPDTKRLEENDTVTEEVIESLWKGKPPLYDSQHHNSNGVAAKNDDDLLVIGVGLMRTGTKSLQLALEQLLGAKCYHMTRVFEQPHHIPVWRQACRQSLTRRQCNQLFSGYRASVDMPGCVFFRDLLRHYPRAKFVLTVRDSDAWYRSVCNTILVANNEMKSVMGSFLLRFTPLAHHAEMVDEVCELALGSDLNWDDEALMRRRFDAHTAAVSDAIPSDRLLIFDPRDGWAPLCQFLDLPIPSSNPYPHVNTYDGFSNNWRAFIRRQYIKGCCRLALYVLVVISLLSGGASILSIS